MRYEDWDILLFPRDCKVPFKEFKVACHVVHDPESPQLGGTFGLPSVCCFVPSLAAGSPFQVSIHSWKAPTLSQFAKSYSQFSENVKFEARLFIDGRIVASTTLDQKSTWPHIIAHAWALSRTTDFEPLKFPSFRQELLQQDWWVPADDLGRIKVILSEGFPRDSVTTPFERIKNIVAFSFQHAPLEILETSSIAWPNPSMWCKAPLATPMEVPTLQSDDSESHAHSPRRQGTSKGGCGQPVNPFGHMPTPLMMTGHRRVTHPLYSALSFPSIRSSDPFGGAAYFEYMNSMGWGLTDNLMRHGVAQRTDRRSSTDISMPDYVPLSSNNQCLEQQQFALAHEDEKLGAHPKAPTNTPTTAGLGGYERDAIGFPIITHNASFPSDLADSLTNSLLNQPMPMHAQHSAFHMPSSEVKSRKENRSHSHVVTSSTAGAPTPSNGQQHQEIRRVSQQMYIPSGSSIPICNVNARTASPGGYDGAVPSATPANAQHGCGSRTSSTEGRDETARMTSDKGTKRSRNFTPASARAIDEEDEPHRASPRVRMTPFVEDRLV